MDPDPPWPLVVGLPVLLAAMCLPPFRRWHAPNPLLAMFYGGSLGTVIAAGADNWTLAGTCLAIAGTGAVAGWVWHGAILRKVRRDEPPGPRPGMHRR